MVDIIDQNPELGHCRDRENVTPHPIEHGQPVPFPMEKKPEKNDVGNKKHQA
jgi:hypothetical protein